MYCCCVGTAPVRFSVQLALIGIALVLKVMGWGPKDVPANLGTFDCRILSLTTEFKHSPSQCGKGAGIKRELWLNLDGQKYVERL